MRQRHAISDDDWARIKDLLPLPTRPAWEGRQGQPPVHRRRPLDRQDRSPLARSARALRSLEFGLAAVRPPGQEGGLAAGVRRAAGPGPGVADPGLDRGPGPPPRRRRPQEWDGSGGQADQALGRSRGGFGTKIPIAVDALGNPVEFILTPGQKADVTQAEALIEGHDAGSVIADKGYDSDPLVRRIEGTGAEAVIPPKKDRKVAREYDKHLYKERNEVERFIGRLKEYRRVATRYEKTDRNYLAFVHVAAVMILLR
jgi:putative transposase